MPHAADVERDPSVELARLLNDEWVGRLGLRQQRRCAVRALRLPQAERVRSRLATGQTIARELMTQRRRRPESEGPWVAVPAVQLLDAAQGRLNADLEAANFGGERRQQGQQFEDLFSLPIAGEALEVLDGEYGVHAAPLGKPEACGVGDGGRN